MGGPDNSPAMTRFGAHLSGPRGRRFREVHLQYRNLQGVGDFSVLVVPEYHSDELAAHMHLDGIGLLRPLDQGDRVEPKQIAQVFFKAPDFRAGQVACSQQNCA